LSYAPGRFETRSVPRSGLSSLAVRGPSQRRALGALFFVLCVFFAGIAAAAFDAGVWPIAIAAATLALWLSTLAGRALLVRRLRGQ
jgi:fructose-1,6-bisphosphatase/inositol monophosphatase family enzyme